MKEQSLRLIDIDTAADFVAFERCTEQVRKVQIPQPWSTGPDRPPARYEQLDHILAVSTAEFRQWFEKWMHTKSGLLDDLYLQAEGYPGSIRCSVSLGTDDSVVLKEVGAQRIGQRSKSLWSSS